LKQRSTAGGTEWNASTLRHLAEPIARYVRWWGRQCRRADVRAGEVGASEAGSPRVDPRQAPAARDSPL